MGYKNKMKRSSSSVVAWMHLLLMGIVFLAFLVGEIEGGLKSVGVTKKRGGGGRGGSRARKTMAGRMASFDAMGNPVAGGGDDDYVEPCVGVCQYHREQKWKRDNGITDPPTTTSTTLDPADRTTKDYGRNAKEIGRGSAVPGAWPGRSPGIYIAAVSSILTATMSSLLLGSKAPKQLYFSGGGKWVQSLNPL